MKFKQNKIPCLSILLLAAVYACNKPKHEKFVGTALDSVIDPTKVDTTKYNAEYLLYSTVRINGVLPLESRLDDFIKVIGKPDSLINFNSNTDCQLYGEPYKYLYFQGNMFYLVKNKAIFQNLDFRRRPDLEITSPAITLNSKTTLQEIQKLFPRAVSKIRTVEDSNFPSLRLVYIGTSKEYADEWWILAFDGDKLVSVEMYAPC
jgi:hypothetical protein